MKTMRAAVWQGPDEIAVQQVERPEVPEGWVLVRVAYNGICGSDQSILHGQHPRASAPLIPGHELSGWVVEPDGNGLAAGTLVTAAPLISCGRCLACRGGNSHVCRDLKLYGIDAPGGMAEYVALPAGTLFPVPATVGPRIAALVEPLAVAVHALSLAGLQPGDLAAVWGAGPIGLLTALMARHRGAREVVVCEPHPWRRSVAAAAGFTVCATGAELAELAAERSGGEGADITFDTAAHPAVAAQMSATTRVRGRIVVVGIYKQPAPVVLRDICFKEQVMVGVRVYTHGDFGHAVGMLARGELDLSVLPTLAFPLEACADAFTAAGGGRDCLKAMVTPCAELADPDTMPLGPVPC